MAFDIKATTEIHNDRIDGAINSLYAAGGALVPDSPELAFDVLSEAATLADSFGHPLLADINRLLVTVA